MILVYQTDASSGFIHPLFQALCTGACELCGKCIITSLCSRVLLRLSSGHFPGISSEGICGQMLRIMSGIVMLAR